MTTTIGGIELDRDMAWMDENRYSKVRASVTPTLGGGMVIQEFQATEKGRLITLVSTETQGVQRKSVVDALKALSDVANATYHLSISTKSTTLQKKVRFVNEQSGGAVQFDPIQQKGGLFDNEMLYKGTIYLMVL